MKVKEAIQQEFVVIEWDRSIQTGKQTMEKSGIDSMPVVFGKNITGMISDRDIDTKILAKDLDPKKARVSNGMTDKLFACGEEIQSRRL